MSLCSCVRWWSIAWLTVLLLEAVAATPARGGDPPPAGKPPDAEDILAEVVRQNSGRNAPPPSRTRRENITRQSPQGFKVYFKSPTQLRVQLPSKAALLTPAIADGRVFVGDGFQSTAFYCVSADNGRPIWGARLPDNGPSAPAYYHGTLSFTTESCTLYVLDAASGNCLWATWLGDPLIAAPSIADDRVLVCYPASATSGAVGARPANFVFAARDLRTGRPLWQRWIDENVISAPVVSGDNVYLTTFAGTLYGFRLSDGEIKLARRCRGTSAPIVAKNAIYLSRRVDEAGARIPQECVAAFDRRTGEPLLASEGRRAIYLAEAGLRPELIKRRSQQTRPSRQCGQRRRKSGLRPASSLCLAIRTTCPAGRSRPIHGRSRSSLSASTGAFDLQRFDGARLTAMGGNLFNCMGDDLLSLDAQTGKVLWSFSLPHGNVDGGEPAALPPAVAGKSLYVATCAGQLLRVDPRNGKIDGSIDIGTPLSTQPVFDNGRLVVGTSSGELIVLKSTDRSLTGWNQWGGDSIRSAGSTTATAADPSPIADGKLPIARAGRELADATRAALRRWVKVKAEDENAEDAKWDLQVIRDELEQDARLPKTQREAFKYAVRRCLKRLGAER